MPPHQVSTGGGTAVTVAGTNLSGATASTSGTKLQPRETATSAEAVSDEASGDLGSCLPGSVKAYGSPALPPLT